MSDTPRSDNAFERDAQCFDCEKKMFDLRAENERLRVLLREVADTSDIDMPSHWETRIRAALGEP